ncbi:hypothetical protein J6590_063039 [Homalodisca vitripennis]|nr:hypothetical protein J6590_063039 [Homalodisca vitripennis]
MLSAGPGLIAYLLSERSRAFGITVHSVVDWYSFCHEVYCHHISTVLLQLLKLMMPNLEGENTIAAEESRDSGFMGESKGRADSFLVPTLARSQGKHLLDGVRGDHFVGMAEFLSKAKYPHPHTRLHHFYVTAVQLYPPTYY